MRFINTLHEGETIRSIYLCKTKRTAETRNGKPYDNLLLQDKTGTLDGKIWDPNSGGIADYDEMDFVEVLGEVISYNNNLQLNIKQLRKPYDDEYNPADYMPTTEKSVDGMYEELLLYIKNVENPYLHELLAYYLSKRRNLPSVLKIIRLQKVYTMDLQADFVGAYTKYFENVWEYYVSAYKILNKDLLYTAAIFHGYREDKGNFHRSQKMITQMTDSCWDIL